LLRNADHKTQSRRRQNYSAATTNLIFNRSSRVNFSGRASRSNRHISPHIAGIRGTKEVDWKFNLPIGHGG
jgi:hypothetical protein